MWNVICLLGAIRSLELELFSLEADIVETPSLGSQGRSVTHLTLLDEESQVDGTSADKHQKVRL